jgi:hypothetical protein
MATSISSDDITECTLAGSSGFASCGGLGMLFGYCFFATGACAFALRFRLAMLAAQYPEGAIECGDRIHQGCLSYYYDGC